MTTVQHMKWWGWGLEGVAFHHEDKPGLRPFVIKAVGLDLDLPAEQVTKFADLRVPASTIGTELLESLTKAVGAEQITIEDLPRVVHTYGKSLRDLLRVRAGDLPRVPDVVVFPADESEVQQIVDLAVEADAVIIPFGGGSNIAGSLQPQEAETRPVISVDMGRMSRVLEIDEGSGLARIQAGTLGPDVEEQLTARGWTLGHYPDSFTHSSIGGWAATRSSGMQSDKYGDMADITRGMRVVRPGQVLCVRPVPATSTGPSVRQMILGSEGRLGVITEVTVQVHRIPENRLVLGYLFPSWEAGLSAMREISVSEAAPSLTRVSDARETAFSFATRKKSTGFSVTSIASKALMAVLARRGWDLDAACLSFVGFEGSTSHVALHKGLVRKIIRSHGGIVLGKGPGELYDQKKFDTPYIRDFLLDRGAAADVSETAAPWSQLQGLYDGVLAAANGACESLGVQGWIMCHLSHSYHSGACLYFTFAFPHGGDNALEQYDTVKGAIQQAFLDAGGTVSHHHAVGTEHSAWLGQDLSPAGLELVSGLLAASDPQRNFNPGKIVP